MSTQILIIEDDEELQRILQMDLRTHGFQTYSANNGQDGLKLFEELQPDLVVLDISLPIIDGWTVCERIRSMSNVPILMMTAHAVNEEDIAKGLNMGADEYMLKPLGNIEFHARVRALLRRAGMTDDLSSTNSFDDGYLNVDLRSRKVSVDGKEIRLTPTEFKLLTTFIRNSGNVLSFQQLLMEVWGAEYTSEHHYPRIYVSHLRRKIEPDMKNPTYIHNEYGIGYRFVGTSA